MLIFIIYYLFPYLWPWFFFRWKGKWYFCININNCFLTTNGITSLPSVIIMWYLTLFVTILSFHILTFFHSIKLHISHFFVSTIYLHYRYWINYANIRSNTFHYTKLNFFSWHVTLNTRMVCKETKNILLSGRQISRFPRCYYFFCTKQIKKWIFSLNFGLTGN